MSKSSKLQKRDTRFPQKSALRVSVHLPGGQHLDENATVVISQKDKRQQLKRGKKLSLYQTELPTGFYTIEVAAAGWQPQKRTFHASPGQKTVSIYLGKRGWPYYRLGESLIPFEPNPQILAVAFESRKPDAKTAARYAEQFQKAFPLKIYELRAKGEDLPFTAGEGSIWLFTLTDPRQRERLQVEIPRLLQRDVRVGFPVDLKQGQVKVIDSRFVVRFRDHLKPSDIENMVKKVNARILRGFIQAGNARLIEFTKGIYAQHLNVIEYWIKQNLLVYGESDIIAQITDDAFPADAPNDPTFPNQDNLTLQNVDNAWQYLNAIDPNLTLGSPDVFVATLDRGVDTDHPDIVGNLTDGTARLATCYDMDGLQPCTVPGYTPDTSHGMGVFGIISANTNNGTAIAGIASNVHHIGLERPVSLTSANYPDALLWAAGFVTGNASAGWPAEPIANAADIISCSHGVDGLALSGLMDDTFKYLSTYGRGGRGTLMIYSSGNGDALITGFRVWAAHERTLGIANSLQPDGGGVERRDPTSNFGPEINLCAQGNSAPSLNPTGGEQIFGGTSASAPTVNAAAALMLSVEPNLTWINLRDILEDTAVIIDAANADAVGQWIDTDGDGVDDFSQWYGNGRLDVLAAVTGADNFDPGAVNIVSRDNLADDGSSVPSSGTFWRSPDIWVRVNDPATDPIGDPAYGDAPPHESADFGVNNWVRVRIKNIGSGTSSDFYVRAYLTHFAGSEFVYPQDYIPSINSGDPLPSPLVQATYLIGEQSGTALAPGEVRILNFLWPAALVPPEEVGGTHWHPCLLAEITPNTGPSPSGNLVVDYSNIVQRNITISYSDDDNIYEMTGVIGNEIDEARIKRIKLLRGKLPKKAKIWVRFLDPKVERAVVKYVNENTHGHGEEDQGCCCNKKHAGTLTRKPKAAITIERIKGHRVFCMQSNKSYLQLDIPMVGGRLTPVVVGAYIPKGTAKGAYEVALIEQEIGGRNLGAFAMEAIVK
jgi:hypothetical protein